MKTPSDRPITAEKSVKVESEPKKSISANSRSNKQIVESSEELKLSSTESE